MAGIGELSVSITARTSKATKNIESFRKRLNSLPKVVSRAASSMAGLATTAAGLIGVGKIGHEIGRSFENIDNLAKTSDKLGIATEKLSALRFAAEENGVAANTTDMALQRMVRRISEAAQGSGEAKNALAELGLSAQRLAQMTPDQQFAELAEAMAGVDNQADRVRLAMRLFDSEGVSLVNTLRIGRDGLAKYEAEARRLGITVSRVDAEQIEKANDAYGRMGKSVEGLTNKIAIGLAPIVEAVADSFTEWGTSGEASTSQVTKGVRGIAKAAAFVQDGIGLWLKAFKSVRAYATEFFAWAAGKFSKFHEMMTELVNAIPGVEKKVSPFAGALADEMKNEAIKARKAADDAWAKPLATTAVDKFFRDVDEKIAKAKLEAERIEKTRADQKRLQEAKRAIGQMATKANLVLVDFWARIKGNAQAAGKEHEKSVKSMHSMMMQQNRQEASVVSARSAEGYAQLRSSLNQSSIAERQLRAEEAQVKQGVDLIEAVKEVARRIAPEELLSFNSV